MVLIGYVWSNRGINHDDPKSICEQLAAIITSRTEAGRSRAGSVCHRTEFIAELRNQPQNSATCTGNYGASQHCSTASREGHVRAAPDNFQHTRPRDNARIRKLEVIQ
jgi:hypothetical protein